jgi:tetratricopeptide (TPR) repeat protein
MAFLVVGSLLISAPSFAQSSPETVVPTKTQLELNDQGVRAMVEGDYSGAVARLERSARLGEANVIYLNLGRAYQKLGNCQKAREALQKAKSVPAVADPPRDEVEAVADKYLAELPKSCPDQPDAETARTPGDDGATDDAGDSEAADTSDPAATARNDSPEDIVAPGSQDDPAAEDGVNLLGWGTTLTGVALVGGGVALHFVAESDRSEVRDAPRNAAGRVETLTQAEAAKIETNADRLDTIGLAVGITGGLAAVAGTYMLVSTDEDAGQLGVGISSKDVVLSWFGRF